MPGIMGACIDSVSRPLASCWVAKMAPANKQRPPHFLDLFCGIGGLSIGLQRAGMFPIGGIDSWDEARITFEKNHPGVKFR